MDTGGGSRLAERIEKLRKEIRDYHGAIEANRIGIRKPIPEMPYMLQQKRKMDTMNIPFVDGGLVDQPFIWMELLAVVVSEMETLDAIRRHNDMMEKRDVATAA